MNDALMRFLPRIDTKFPTLFVKTKNDKGVDGVATMSMDKTGNTASTGWCIVDVFPDEKFQLTPSELKSILELGRSLSIKDSMLVAENTEFQSSTYWKYIAPTKAASVSITYKEQPIVLPKNIIQHLVKTIDLNPKTYTFTSKNNILTIQMNYENVDTSLNSGEHTLLRLPVSNLPEGTQTFDGPSLSSLLSLLNDNAEFTITFENKPSRITLTDEGFVVHHYIMPIQPYSQNPEITE